ncbi:MAG: glycosyltransferase family 2 protein [Bacilli bacterium]|nr:glycosyltransferase family 2 protein [Bacilli bacterium]
MKLSIIIPVYNEEKFIQDIIERVKNSNTGKIKKEIIIVDDCSSDNTRKILKKKINKKVDKIIYHEHNQGKGAALRTGIKEATGDVVIIQDADFEYDPNDYLKVVTPIFENKAEVVYGSRFLNKKFKGYKKNIIANKFLTFLSNLFSHQKITDMETCYKAFKREVIQSITIEENRFGFEPEITAKIANKKIKIHEVEISYNPRSHEDGKKINYKDGLRAIYCIIKYGRH